MFSYGYNGRYAVYVNRGRFSVRTEKKEGNNEKRKFMDISLVFSPETDDGRPVGQCRKMPGKDNSVTVHDDPNALLQQAGW